MSQVPGSIAMGLGLWVPDETREEFAIAEHAEGDVDIALAFRRKLKDVDSRLDLIWVKSNATSFPVTRRWYITRKTNEGKYSAFWIVQTDTGKYCPPTDQHFEALMARDSWAHPDVWNRLRRTRQTEQRQAAGRREEQRREFREKLLEQLDFNHRVQTAITPADKAKL